MIANLQIPQSRCGVCVMLWIVFCVCGCEDKNLLTSKSSGASTEISGDSLPARPLTVQVLRLQQRPAPERTIVLYGQLTPQRQQILRFQRPGRVTGSVVAVGERVKAGTKLASIAQPELEQQRTELQRQRDGMNNQLQILPPDQTQTLQGQLKSVQDRLMDIERQIAASALIAPFDGVVSKCQLVAGQITNPVTSLVEIISDEQPFVACDLSHVMQPSQASNITFWVSIDGTVLQATVDTAASILAPNDSTRTHLTHLKFKQELSSELWKFGSICEIRVRTTAAASGFWIPQTALRLTSDHVEVLVAEEDADGTTLVAKTVSIMESAADFVRVEGDIGVGNAVVLQGGHRVVAGQSVLLRVTPSTSTSAEVAP